MVARGLSERRALAVADMSASALRYTPVPDRNGALRARIVALAHRHRRYGAGLIHLKLRQAGDRVNHKRVHRLYVAERLQIRRRRRKKVPVADRQPLVKPTRPNEVWSADCVFDRTAEGRVVKCLAIVDEFAYGATSEGRGNVDGTLTDPLCSVERPVFTASRGHTTNVVRASAHPAPGAGTDRRRRRAHNLPLWPARPS